MQHPLVLANTYVDLLTERQTIIKRNEINHFEEFHIYNYMQRMMTGVEGEHVILSNEYFDTDGFIDDIAFVIESIQTFEPAQDIVHFVREIGQITNQEDEDVFLQAVSAKLTEYAGVEKELATVEE